MGNCFQIENVLFGQFECHSDCKNTYTFINWYYFNAPHRICYANEYMLVLDLTICAKVSKTTCIKNMMGHPRII